ncbi:MAG: lysylphosphatidylglycerol synthase transmembrane domain-containing protein [Syntrophaceticus sp.]
MRILIIALVILLASLFGIMHFTEGAQLLATLQAGIWYWIAIAIVAQLLVITNRTGLYHALYRFYNVPEKFKRLFTLVLATSFVGIIAPGGMFTGTAVIIHDAVRRGITFARAVMINYVFFMLTYSAFSLVMVIGLAYLVWCGNLTVYSTIAAVLLVALIAAQVGLIILALHRPQLLPKIAKNITWWLQPRVKKYFKKDIDETKAIAFAKGLVESVRLVAQCPRGLGRAAGHALMMELFNMITLWSVFQAFHYTVPLGKLIAGYSVGILFVIISITPSGIGVVEPLMTAAFSSLGVPLETAALGIFVYRGISVWLPFMLGFVGLRLVGKMNKSDIVD